MRDATKGATTRESAAVAQQITRDSVPWDAKVIAREARMVAFVNSHDTDATATVAIAHQRDGCTMLTMKKRWVLKHYEWRKSGSKWTELLAYWAESGRLIMPSVAYGPGCYAIFANGQLVYVGMSDRVHLRVAAHMKDGAATLQRALGVTHPQAWLIKYRPERFYGERATLELRLIRRLKPLLNRMGLEGRKRSPLPPVNQNNYRRVAS